MIETSSGLPRKSSAIFGNLRKFSENVRQRSCYLRTIFGKSSGIFGKWSEIIGKSSITPSLVCLYNKKKITLEYKIHIFWPPFNSLYIYTGFYNIPTEHLHSHNTSQVVKCSCLNLADAVLSQISAKSNCKKITWI